MADNPFHVSLRQAAAFETYRQFFAAFIPDGLKGDRAAFYFDRIVSRFNHEMRHTGDSAGFYGYLSVENCSASGGTLAGIRRFRERGVRMASLTWNGDNEFGCGCRTKNDTGLTDLGREAVRVFCADGIVTDLSHLSPRGFDEVMALTERYGGRAAASHSNCLTAANESARARGLSERQVKMLVERGFPCGLNLYGAFLSDEKATMADVLRNIEYALALGAGDILALGCDFDGCEPAEDLAGIGKLPLLNRLLRDRGLSEQAVDAIFYTNAARFFDRQNNL